MKVAGGVVYRSVISLVFYFPYIHFNYKDMQRKKPDVDVIKDLLAIAVEAKPESAFLRSLSFQYEERGGLSKKQLEGLYQKIEKIPTIPVHKLATLEAVILKKPTRYKSAKPGNEPLYQKDERVGAMINAILAKFPEHKRVIFFRTRYENNETLSSAEITELERFHKILMAKANQ